jgi:antitoxin component of MazEF toxin-antitoxin module
MTMEIQIRRCADGLSIVLPESLISQLAWGQGDILSVEVIAHGATLTRAMTAHDHAMKIADEMMDKYKETFEALAKS